MKKIYTKSGDSGDTGLVGGTRVRKSDPRLDLYGEVDDLNSWVGAAVAHLSVKSEEVRAPLERIQNWLFDLGSNLACERENREKFKLPRLTEEAIYYLEQEIDRMDEQLEPLKNFILPGGALAGSFLHIARTKTRKIERKLVSFLEAYPDDLPCEMVVFINRLSDYFFVAARLANRKERVSETIWKS